MCCRDARETRAGVRGTDSPLQTRRPERPARRTDFRGRLLASPVGWEPGRLLASPVGWEPGRLLASPVGWEPGRLLASPVGWEPEAWNNSLKVCNPDRGLMTGGGSSEITALNSGSLCSCAPGSLGSLSGGLSLQRNLVF
ncbi:hypothetical protein CesoFtcFv8_009636 [Champsocephalus esox]|uniref:Uncharacterized protein n=1 Tax=Champsocephalus esox TaxID=159716 RepID=A0AAN8C3L6_9TELE|nr:hypothetical protein CesoFtcFv8_009636 [Champsocephalus esox]